MIATVALPAPAAAAPSPFVKRAGTNLRLEGKPYRFTGLNIYNANSVGKCWYTMGAVGLGHSLDKIGPGKEAFRAWFFQRWRRPDGHRDWSAFDHTLAVARAHGVKVIATLANQWGTAKPGGYKTEAGTPSGYTQPDPAGPSPTAMGGARSSPATRTIRRSWRGSS